MTSSRRRTRWRARIRSMTRAVGRRLRRRADARERRHEHESLRTLLNDGDGSLVVARHRDLDGTSAFECVETDVGRIWMLRTDSVILPALRESGTWEPGERAFLARRITDGATTINVGANVGYTALTLSTMVGERGQVHALEPDPLNHRLLCLNTRRAGNIMPIHTAAGDRTGTIELQRSATNTGDHRTAPHEDGIGGVTVPVIRIDDLWADRHVDAIVCDTQGVDHRVIDGARITIERCRPLITVEFWPFGIRNAGDDPVAVIEQYLALGYASMVIVPTGEDVTGLPAPAVIERAMAEVDATTLALLP